jgi:predicted O-linked N-acetylglucosamine transferase (SPINDLY family)
LAGAPSSVLWLLNTSTQAEANLRREVAVRGIDPSRLVFSPPMESPEHLARHALADLFLDTLPINAHTTASDALWAGLPVLTVLGDSFAGRVAASLLHAVALPEMVAGSLADYEAIALALAHDPARLAALKQKLAANITKAPLFAIEPYARHLEAAYLKMWDIYAAGRAPEPFRIEP